MENINNNEINKVDNLEKKRLEPSNFSPEEIHRNVNKEDNRREKSEIIIKSKQLFIEVQRDNSFPVTKIHYDDIKIENDDLFVESPVVTAPSTLGSAVIIKQNIQSISLKEVPWKALLTNLGVVSMYNNYYISYVVHTCCNWTFYILVNYFPSYIKDIYEVSTTTASLMTLFPYLTYTLIQLFTSPVGDYLIKKGISVLNVRKLYIFFSNIVSGLFMVIAAYMNNITLTVIFFTLSTGFSGISITGYNANILDITTKYSGITMGISNTFATIHIFFYYI